MIKKKNKINRVHGNGIDTKEKQMKKKENSILRPRREQGNMQFVF